jgi:penicillin-binding protein 1A
MRKIVKWFLIFFIWIAIFSTLAFFYYIRDLPTLTEMEKINDIQMVRINYSNQENIAIFNQNSGSEISFYELPTNLINAIIATEDRRFFDHHGFDIFAVIRAAIANHQAGHIVQGGSTITQQLAKMLFLDSKKNIKRKIQELLLAIQLERKFSKEQLLTFYLNKAYFGSGNYGVGNAAKFYFSKDVSQLNLKESAILAGILKAPSKFSPKNNLKLSHQRADQVIQNMFDAGFMDEKNIYQLDEEINFFQANQNNKFFADYVFSQFRDFLPHDLKDEKRINISSTLNYEIQTKLNEISANFYQKNIAKINKAEVAVIVMKKNGEVVAVQGGWDYKKSQFNRAIFAKRQIGSAFKVFVYLAAFEKGYQLTDEFEDKKLNFGDWLPENYEKKYFGKISLKQAFAKSSNSVAIQLAQKVGINEVKKTAKKLGIISEIKDNDLSIALGSSQVSLLEITSSYASILNDGEVVIPYFIEKISNDEDKILYQRYSSGVGKIISDQAREKIMIALRENVVSGTAKKANVKNNIYGKTATSQNYQDAWFIGFDDEFVIGIWMGNDDNSATKKIVGGSLPAEFFGEIMAEISS